MVYALPAPATGWVEVQCSPIPEDFTDTATVVLSNTETRDYYTITCYKINDYIGRLQLPLGTYQVEQTSTADNFAYEAVTETQSFELTAHMPAAQLITLSIIKHDVSYALPTEPAEDITENATPGAVLTDPTSSENPDSKPSSTPSVSNPVLDWIAKESASSETDAEASTESAPAEEGFWVSSGKNVIYAIVGTILFILFITAIAFFARQHYENQ